MKTPILLTILLAGGIYTVLSGQEGGRNSGSDIRVSASDIHVIDGDTIAIGDDRYRLMGFDTPETYRSKCAAELALGKKATRRLKALIADASALELEVASRRDKYGRKLARAFVFDQDVGSILISEGLARKYSGGKRMPWCTSHEDAALGGVLTALPNNQSERKAT
jgi:endonuclease YncB( thermonuclease family)